MNEIIQFISIIDIKFYLASSVALTISIVMKNADIALYESKEKGSNGFAFYNEKLNIKSLGKY